jgi:hypothetical protein
MPDFISALEALSQNPYMSEVNYVSLNENQREFIRPDMWEATFATVPLAVYFPGHDIIKKRLTGIQPSIPTSVSGIQQIIRGYIINQKTSQNTSGTVNLVFTDREDQSITAFCNDWRNKISDPDNKYSFRKEVTIADVEHKILNTSRVPLRTLLYKTCQPNDIALNEEGTSDVEVTSSLSEVTLGLDFEHFKRIFHNI